MPSDRIGSSFSTAWYFLGATLFLTWTFWIPAGIWGSHIPTPGILGLHLAGGAMPFLIALLLTLRQGKPFQRDFWLRVLDFHRITPGWYAVLILLIPVLMFISGWVDQIFRGAGLALEPRFTGNLLSLVSFAFITLLFGPIPEELGWRGFALDGLQTRWNPLIASLALGIVWTIWHLPLFWIDGSYQHSLLGSPRACLFLLDKLPLSILMTWIYNHTRRSTLSAILFHFMMNFTGELLELSVQTERIYLALLYLTAAGVTVYSIPGAPRSNVMQ